MRLPSRFAEILTEGESLAPLTTWKIGGHARSFLRPRSAEEAAAVFAEIHEQGLMPRILGGGANLLIHDGEHEAPFIHLSGMSAIEERENGFFVEAGYPFLKLVGEMGRLGRSGLEGLAGIPGQLGGICRMNAGGKWGEIQDVIESVRVATRSGTIIDLGRDECGFGYRHSEIPGLILGLHLKLGHRNAGELRQVAGRYLKLKAESQPLKLPSGGCVFANPPGQSVGRLVEELGLKGQRIGDAEISSLHGNFIVNLGAARFRDVQELMALISAEVLRQRGLTLRPEVEVWAPA